MQELTGRAFAQAQEADHGWVGPEHLLLALLARPSVAAETLAELGVTHQRLAGHLRDRPGDPDHRPCAAPARLAVAMGRQRAAR